MASPDFDRPMTADQANLLLNNISKELKRRNQWSYNNKITPKYKFDTSLTDLNNVSKKYKPQKSTIDPENRSHIGNPKVILDIHGMAIINSILKINSINDKMDSISHLRLLYTKKMIGGVIAPPTTSKYCRVWTNAYKTDEINNLINNLSDMHMIILGSVFNPDEDLLNRVYLLFSDPEMRSEEVMKHIHDSLLIFRNQTPIHEVQKQDINKYNDKNISIAFDYYILTFLCEYIKLENDLFYAMSKAINGYKNDHIPDKTRWNSHFMSNNSPYEPSTCRVVCTGLCTKSCNNTCNGCGGTCTKYCTGNCETNCAGTCTINCKSECNASCREECNGCTNECDGTCSINCSSTCGASDCSGHCGGDCKGSCYSSETGTKHECGCGSECVDTCGSNCKGSSNDIPLPVDPDPPPEYTEEEQNDPNYYKGGGHPNSYWKSNADGSGGHWVYQHTNGDVYHSTEQNTTLNHSDGDNLKTPWDNSNTNHNWTKQ